MKTIFSFRSRQFYLLLTFALVSGCAIKQSATQPHRLEFRAVVGAFTGSVDDNVKLRLLMAMNGLDDETRGSVTNCCLLVPVSKAALACKILSKNSLTAKGKVQLYTNSINPLEFGVSVGSFSGSRDDIAELDSLLENSDVDGGLDGSLRYDIFVPAARAVLACKILRTNDLTFRGKIQLYSSIYDQEKLIRETAAHYKPSDARKMVTPLFSTYHFAGRPGPAVPETEIPKGIRVLPLFSETPDFIITLWVGANTDGMGFLNVSGSGIFVCKNENSREFDGSRGFEYWGDGIYFCNGQ